METELLILRDYCEADFPEYYRLKSDPATMRYLQDIQVLTREAAYEDFCMVLCDMQKPDRRFYFLHIELKVSHEQLGSAGYTATEDTPAGKIVGAGYFLYPKFWGRGYAAEAFKRVIEFAFTEGNVCQISTGCLAENAGSERVMQKCGLTMEARHVGCQWHEGELKTRLEYRVLKKEWERRPILRV